MEASTALLMQQWRESSNLPDFIDAFLSLWQTHAEDAMVALEAQRTIDQASGVWLDYLGQRLGILRPYVTVSSTDSLFGFDSAGVGFDQARFRGLAYEETKEPLSDASYRKLLHARAEVDISSGGLDSLERAVECIDEDATVTDNYNMTVTIDTTEDTMMTMALNKNCLPVPAGVTATIT